MQTLGDVITAMLILAALIVVPYKIVKAWLWPEIVNRYQARSVYDMSSAAAPDPPSPLPRLETDAGQTPDRPAPPKLRAEELFPLYKAMRAAGIKREDAQAACVASGLPFNNNVWSKAAPPPPAHVTPIVGRSTDADFPYQPIEH